MSNNYILTCAIFLVHTEYALQVVPSFLEILLKKKYLSHCPMKQQMVLIPTCKNKN